MLKISVFTSTRADYGLLYWLAKAIDEADDLQLQLIVTGTHLSVEYGYTLDEILKDGFEPSELIDTLIGSDKPAAICKSGALMAAQLVDFFEREKPDYFVVLGDRFELLAACQAAVVAKIPIVHLHGGEVTEGAIDDNVRHAVTKLASLHFASAEQYRRRIIQMGERAERVVTCGALGLEGIYRYELLDRKMLSHVLGVDLSAPYFLVVYHPETYSNTQEVGEILRVLSEYPQYRKIVIYPNADAMSREIISEIEQFAQLPENNATVLKSLSHKVFLSLMACCESMIGNSSSGVIEAPSVRIPTVNIGSRQTGRLRGASIIDVDSTYQSIKSGVQLAISEQFRELVLNCQSPYGGSAASDIILETIRTQGKLAKINDGFVDLEFDK